MAESLTLQQLSPQYGEIAKWQLDWTSAADGSVDLETLSALAGIVLGVQAKPDTGDTAPTSTYTITCTDEQGGAVFSYDGSTGVITATSRPVADKLSVVIAGAGDSKGGSVFIYTQTT